MKKRLISLIIALAALTSCGGNMKNEQIKIDDGKIFNADYSSLVSASDLSYRGQIDFGPWGMPVANGRFGGPVWEPSGRVLAMQLNHTDVFMYNDASAESTYDNGALGKLEIDFGEDVFGEGTLNALSLYDAKLTVTGSGVFCEVISSPDSDTVLLRITDSRAEPKDIAVTLNMLRSPEVKRGLFSAMSYMTDENGIAELEQVFSEVCSTGISSNDHYCHTALAMKIEDFEPNISGGSAKMTIPAQSGQFTVVLGASVSMDESDDVKQTALDNCEASDFDSVYSDSAEFWADYWSKSYVDLPSYPEYEQRRTYYFYLAGISNRGSFPSKYNGGIWIAEGDRRDWGSWYWNWNQDSLYQPFEQANHGELLEPLFAMRERCYEQYKVAARQLWGIESGDAMFIGETSGILGAETLPEEVAEDEYRFLKGVGMLTDEISELGSRRNSFLVPWNYQFWGGSSASYVTHTMVATQETAEYFWQKYLYTGDEVWLREHAYKFIKGAAELYRNYYGFVKEDDGKYHFNRTNLHEHIWAGRDVIDDLSLARGIFAVAIKASEILGIDEDMRPLWQDCLDNIAPYPMSDEKDAIAHDNAKASEKAVWALGREPAVLVRGFDTETPQFKMLEKFDVLNLETRDQKKDKGDFKRAVATFYCTPGYQKQVLDSIPDLNGSSRFLEDAAKLGLTDELEKMFATQFKMFQNTPNLIHDQGDYYSAEGYGTWSQAIQQALMQSLEPLPGDDPVIRVFPAWNKEKEASFKLLTKGGFLVYSACKSGEVSYLGIESQSGGVCRIRSPWAGADIYRNGVKEKTVRCRENALLELDTEAGDRMVILPKGAEL